MDHRLMQQAEKAFLKPKVPEFRIGDSVDVLCRIVEGDKERVQAFSGVVIARKGSGINANFTVRRLVKEEGVERIFPLHSPNVVDIKVRKHGKVRRAKLYYLRHRVGKARRVRELRVTRKLQEPELANSPA